jgi:hypothetical protein
MAKRETEGGKTKQRQARFDAAAPDAPRRFPCFFLQTAKKAGLRGLKNQCNPCYSNSYGNELKL